MALKKDRNIVSKTPSSDPENLEEWGAHLSSSLKIKIGSLVNFEMRASADALEHFVRKMMIVFQVILGVWTSGVIGILFSSATIETFRISDVVLATLAGATVLLIGVVSVVVSVFLVRGSRSPDILERSSRTPEKQFAAIHRAWALIREVEHLKHLEDNWNSYGGKAPSETAINNAVFALVEGTEGQEVLPDYIDPSNDESIIFTYQRGQDQYLLEFYNDGDVVFLKHVGDNPPTTSEITRDDLGKALRTIGSARRHALHRSRNPSTSAHEQ